MNPIPSIDTVNAEDKVMFNTGHCPPSSNNLFYFTLQTVIDLFLGQVFEEKSSNSMIKNAINPENLYGEIALNAQRLDEMRGKHQLELYFSHAAFPIIPIKDDQKLTEFELNELITRRIQNAKKQSKERLFHTKLSQEEEQQCFSEAMRLAEMINNGQIEKLKIYYLNLVKRFRERENSLSRLAKIARTNTQELINSNSVQHQINQDTYNLAAEEKINYKEKNGILAYIKLREISSGLSKLIQMIKTKKHPKFIEKEFLALNRLDKFSLEDLSNLISILKKEDKEILVNKSGSYLLIVNQEEINKVLKHCLARLKYFSRDFRKEKLKKEFQGLEKLDFAFIEESITDYQKKLSSLSKLPDRIV